MFSIFKKKNTHLDRSINTGPVKDPVYNFKWYETGEGNPFQMRVLDIRSYTQHMISTTKDPNVAEGFVKNRASIGQEYRGFAFNAPTVLEVSLTYPHNGEKMEGAGYKAGEMEDKWDIYCWDNVMYFVRSWTGDVGYKAQVTYNDNHFSIQNIEFQRASSALEEQSIALNNVHFLISTLLFKRVQPHKIPRHLLTNEEIAAYSFAAFGRNSWYATYEDVIDSRTGSAV